ncbi:MAG: glycosyltransferase family 4 protein [Candidatus Symbiothrix sp.]|jgi:glycosyltransferase involved in cell wall biosynthesis|nr:glycosyltransferase family 4 protein [Candidatus Symbiothrix sp.]
MKIAYSIKNLGNSGGIERVLSSKANYFADQLEYEVHIIVSEKKPHSLFYPFSGKIRFHYLDIIFPKRKPWEILFPNEEDKIYEEKLSRVLNKIHPEITISTFGPDASFLYKLKDGSIKILEFHFTKNYLKHLGESLQNDKFRWIRKYWLDFLQRRETYLSGKYDHIVVLTEKDKQLWGGNDKFTVIPNPLSFQTEKTALLENQLIVSMGRLVYPKGFSYLIDAFASIQKKYPDWQLHIYGDGSEKDILQNQINQLALQDKILLKKPDADVESILLDASLFVLPSLYDGFGLVLTEAMACGVPCIAFDCECGPSEIISDNEDGFLVELKNVPLLAGKMELLMMDKRYRKEMGKRAKDNVLKFDTEKIMKLWQTYFEKLLVHNT